MINAMKLFYLLSFALFFLNCKSQNQEFETFLSNFKRVALPFKIDRKNYGTIFFPNNKYREIEQSNVLKFIYQDPDFKGYDTSEYRYDYGIQFDLQGFKVVVFHKEHFEGKTVYDFDLVELVLNIYSKEGRLLSSRSITKDNDGWMSETLISDKKIEVQQIKILEFNKPELACEISRQVFKITEKGAIDSSGLELVGNGVVVWDQELKDYKLKEKNSN
jgi:hypothetical protein